jgi:hypothetical protein
MGVFGVHWFTSHWRTTAGPPRRFAFSVKTTYPQAERSNRGRFWSQNDSEAASAAPRSLTRRKTSRPAIATPSGGRTAADWGETGDDERTPHRHDEGVEPGEWAPGDWPLDPTAVCEACGRRPAWLVVGFSRAGV